MGNRRLRIGLFAAFVLIFLTCHTEAALYRSYIYDSWGMAVPTPDPYLPARVIYGEDIGAGDLKNPQDIYVAPDKTLYIVDSGNNRIIRTTSFFEVIKIYKEFERDGVVDSFNNPQSVYVTHDGRLFVADTGKERIVQFDADGNFAAMIDKVQTDMTDAFPNHFRFRPKKIAVDPFDRLYVIVDGLYEGLMKMDLEGNFLTFVGAPRVALTLWQYLWNRIASEEQRARMALVLPTEYSSMHMDEQGFILTTISGGEIQLDHFVRKLNPSGADIMKRTGVHPLIGDLDLGIGTSLEGNSRFVDIVGRENELFSVLDQQRGRVFTYDGTGRLLYVFGGLGQGVGLFVKPVAIDELNGQLLVLDNRTNSITVFEPTNYATLIHNAINEYHRGQYDEAANLWHQVTGLNANYELAYSGVGDAEFSKGNYAQAMLFYRVGNDRAGYSKAFYRYRRELLGEHFGTIMTWILIAAGLRYISSKRQWRARLVHKYHNSQLAAALSRERVKNNRFYSYCHRTIQAVRYAGHVIFHPFDGFWDLKYENRGTFTSATVLLLIVVASYVFVRQYTGFVLNYNRISDLNVLMEASSILLPFLLWCLVNWALTTLMDGKGRIKDIYIAGAYAFTPMILINFPVTIISKYITIEEGTFYYLLLAIGVIWSLALLFLGTGVIHDYSFGKTIFTTLTTIVGIGVVCFVGLLFFHVIDTMVQFFREIYLELTFR